MRMNLSTYSSVSCRSQLRPHLNNLIAQRCYYYRRVRIWWKYRVSTVSLTVVQYVFRARRGSIDGRVMVNRSIELGEPVVLVSMNYR